MATYRAKQDLYLSGEARFVYAGEEFASEEKPGTVWEPLDAAAKKARGGNATSDGPGAKPDA